MSLTLQRRGLVDEYNGYQFRRESMAHDSAGKLIYPHNARFEQGPFGSDKAILVEEGTANLVDLRTWNPVGEDNHQIVSATDKTFRGFPVYKVQKKTTSTPPLSLGKFDIPAGETITASIWVNAMDSVDRFPRIFFFKNNTIMGKEFRDVKVGEWGRLITTYTNDTDEIIEGVSVYFYPSTPVDSITYFSSPQVEWGSYATTFTPSVRADESLTVPIEGLLSPEQGTVEMWVNVNKAMLKATPLIDIRRVFWDTGFANLDGTYTLYYHQLTQKVIFRIAGSGNLSSIEIAIDDINNGWHKFSCGWDNSKMSLYIDDNLIGEWTNPPLATAWYYKNIEVGRYITRNTFTNTTFAYLRLSSIARTADQLAPLDAPPTVDEYTTLYLPFNGPDNVRAAKVVTL